MGFDKTIEVMAEMIILAAVMLLAAFFCYRVLLLSKATDKTIIKIYEVEEIIPEWR